jgi:hypothetical protein
MRVERQRVTDLLRSRGNDMSADLAARSLPATIDLFRDQFLLRQCGIDPHTLALDLNLSDRSGSTPTPAEPTDGHVVPEKAARPPTHDNRPSSGGARVGTVGLSRGRPGLESRPAACPRCDLRFSSVDAMLDHLSSHLRQARPGRQLDTGLSIVLSAMPSWQVDAALSDLERSMRRPRLPRLLRAILRYALLSIIVLAALVFVVAGHPVLGMMVAASAVLLADGRPVRYLRKVRGGRARQSGAK